ncbi:MAG: hypothetical protein KC897_11710 [Candidatus Omnitrophica bacterium]|nr:hypothetical protein [Candidatus Omnitrophota bacterium]MCB9719341.1 hypothetical protein [Candidatus Omnitrophota bacterium]
MTGRSELLLRFSAVIMLCTLLAAAPAHAQRQYTKKELWGHYKAELRMADVDHLERTRNERKKILELWKTETDELTAAYHQAYHQAEPKKRREVTARYYEELREIRKYHSAALTATKEKADLDLIEKKNEIIYHYEPHKAPPEYWQKKRLEELKKR